MKKLFILLTTAVFCDLHLVFQYRHKNQNK